MSPGCRRCQLPTYLLFMWHGRGRQAAAALAATATACLPGRVLLEPGPTVRCRHDGRCRPPPRAAALAAPGKEAMMREAYGFLARQVDK